VTIDALNMRLPSGMDRRAWLSRISPRRSTMRVLSMMALTGLFICADLSRAGEITCGIATGFPPYQFEQDRRAGGFDADIMRMVAKRADLACRFRQDKWDDVVGLLSIGHIDCVVGMEINPFREKSYDFNTAYYLR
jgi:ABC-type amino acid transport substrate-binding protein